MSGLSANTLFLYPRESPIVPNLGLPHVRFSAGQSGFGSFYPAEKRGPSRTIEMSGRGKKLEKIAKISNVLKKVEFLWKLWPILQSVVFFNQLHQLLLRKFYPRN